MESASVRLPFSLLLATAILEIASALAQPGALDVYPPTQNSTISVDLDHFRFNEKKISLRYLGYDRFVSDLTSP
eukprot:8277738-Pyramimonas_sp.AAC.1